MTLILAKFQQSKIIIHRLKHQLTVAKNQYCNIIKQFKQSRLYSFNQQISLVIRNRHFKNRLRLVENKFSNKLRLCRILQSSIVK